MSSGCRSACSRGLIEPQCDDVTTAIRHGRPIVISTATSSDQRVDRTERSFVHSERMTRICVTLPVCGRRGSDWSRSRCSRCELPALVRCAAKLDVFSGQLHEGFFERGLLRRKLVQDDLVCGGQFADSFGGGALDFQ